jgi:hypothetical protein
MTERDPHLLAALRHAPDHAAAPPPEVTARILAAARDAVRPTAPLPAWRRWLDGLMRPQVGAAFATLAVATLVGVMWSANEPPPSAPVSAPEAVAVLPKAASAAAPSVADMPPGPPAVRANEPPPAAAERRAAERGTAPVTDRAVAEVLPQQAAAAPPAEALAKAEASAAPAPVPAPAAPAPAPTTDTAPVAPRLRDERIPATNQLGAATGRQAAAPARSDAAQAYDPLLALEAAGLDTASWQVAGLGGERPHGPAQRALWAALRAATQSRWDVARAAPPPTPWLALRQDARLTPIWAEGGALYTLDPEGRAWRAPVSAALLAAWQAEVARW